MAERRPAGYPKLKKYKPSKFMLPTYYDKYAGKPADSGEPSGEVIRWYRVRKTWADSKSQKGAYKILDNAKKCADQNPGYKVFYADGKIVYEPKAAEPAGFFAFLLRFFIEKNHRIAILKIVLKR